MLIWNVTSRERCARVWEFRKIDLLVGECILEGSIQLVFEHGKERAAHRLHR